MTRHEVKAVVLSDNAKWIVVTLLTLLSMLGSGYNAYSRNDKAVSNELVSVGQRVTAVERQRQEDKDATRDRLERIENKLDRLIERGMK